VEEIDDYMGEGFIDDEMQENGVGMLTPEQLLE
jgi:hypothetical protein